MYFSTYGTVLIIILMHRWANERDETDEMIRLLHRLIAKVGDGYDGQYTRQKVCCIAVFTSA